MAYANRILTTTTYHDEVRARLGVSLKTLSDTDIDAPSVLPVAEALVVSRAPDYASLKNDDQNYVYAAAVSMVAAVLAPSMPARLKASEGDSDYKYTNQNVDWHARARTLTEESYSLLDLISTQTTVELPQFGASGPTRAAQQAIVNQGGSTKAYPDSGDLWLYPTRVE